MDLIYLDNNATTPLLPAVREAMEPFFAQTFGNPASSHRAGRAARRALEDARETVAQLLGADADEVLFTSGATESNNLALLGLAGESPGHIVVSPIEHPSVIEPIAQLAGRGFTVDRLPVDSCGVVRLDAFPDDPRLLVVQLANHETGVVQSISVLANRLRKLPGEAPVIATSTRQLTQPVRLDFHTDATQAVGKMPVRFHDLGASSLSLSAHKFHGPKGVGALLVRRGCKLRPLLFGGHQQQGRRPGTEPVALAVGVATALRLAHDEMPARQERVLALRRRFLAQLREKAAPVILNGPDEGERGFVLPHTLNLSFPGCPAESLLMNLDLAGVACSTGSACSSGSLLPSPVLRAMGVPDERLRSAMRFSLSYLLTEAEIDEAARRFVAVCTRLRAHNLSESVSEQDSEQMG
jgi:cysteine desulfurase